MTHLAIFASGRGSNADTICEYFKDHESVKIAIIVSNKQNPGVRDVALQHHVTFAYHSNDEFKDGERVLDTLRNHRIDYIILAGFLRKIPISLIKAFSRRIVNIHPALLPKYGGKGMYGKHVHEAVKKNGDSETGITIHFVNHEYDKGQVIFQTTCEIADSDTVEDIANKVQKLEHHYFPRVIESVIDAGKTRLHLQ